MPDLPWYVYAMLLAPLGLILFAAAYKTLQVRAAREWPSTPGKVVISNSEVRDVRVLDDSREIGHRFEQRNFANIVYEYTARGQLLRNNRVSIGEDRGNFEVAETIARYPAGMAAALGVILRDATLSHGSSEPDRKSSQHFQAFSNLLKMIHFPSWPGWPSTSFPWPIQLRRGCPGQARA